MLKKFLLAAALAVAPISCAYGQGQFQPGQVFGNPNAGAGQGLPASVSAILDRALGSTRGAIIERGASGWAIVGPSATVGVPWVGNGTGADPAYQVLGVVGGGTGLAVGTSGGVPCFTSTTGMGSSALLTQNGVVYGGGAGVCPGSAAAGTNGQIFLGVTGSPPQMATMSQDCTITNAGVITCTKTNNVSFAPSATTDTTNASNISSGTLPAGRLPAPTASTFGGVQSLTCSSHNWFSSLSTAGVFGCTQPNFTDLAGTIAGAQIPSSTITNAMLVSGGANTIKASLNGTNEVDTSVPNCTVATQALQYTSGTGFSCATIAASGTRTLLNANATYFVRTVPVAVTISNASPAVVTHNSHGYSAGQLVTYNSTGTLPTGLTAGTIYCVLAAGLATNTYEVGATCGGAAINTSSAGSGIFTEQAGNDLTGNGSAQTATAAFMTLQGAINYTQQNIDLGNFTATIQAACAGGGGVALYGSTQVDMPFVGGLQSQNTPSVDIKGDTTTPTNCVIQDVPPVGSAFAAQENTNVKIEGFSITSTTNGGYGLLSDTGANLWVGAMNFGAMTGTGNPAHMNAHAAGRIFCQANYSINGSAGIHWYIERNGFLECNSLTVTITGTPNFSGAFAFADNGGQIYTNGVTFSGSATGVRYSAQYMGSIHTNSASTTYFPGNSAGSPAVNTFSTSGASCCGHYNFLLKRDINPATNDNTPMFLRSVA